jgi:hypothetical protein
MLRIRIKFSLVIQARLLWIARFSRPAETPVGQTNTHPGSCGAGVDSFNVAQSRSRCHPSKFIKSLND